MHTWIYIYICINICLCICICIWICICKYVFRCTIHINLYDVWNAFMYISTLPFLNLEHPRIWIKKGEKHIKGTRPTIFWDQHKRALCLRFLGYLLTRAFQDKHGVTLVDEATCSIVSFVAKCQGYFWLARSCFVPALLCKINCVFFGLGISYKVNINQHASKNKNKHGKRIWGEDYSNSTSGVPVALDQFQVAILLDLHQLLPGE